MPHRRLVELSGDHDLPVHRVGVLAWMFSVSSALCIVAATTGRSPAGGRTLLLVVASVGAVVAVGLWALRGRWTPPVVLQVLLGVYSLSVASLAFTADTVNGVTSLGPAVIITCAYAGCFYRRSKLWLQVAISVGSYTVAAFLSAPPTAWTSLLTAASAAIAIAAVLHGLTAQLRRRSLHDSLTGTVSRTAWMAIAEKQLLQRGSRPITVAMIDFDRFKHTNDTLGHQAGDRLLHDVCQAWQEALEGQGLIGRYGGDEFTVLFLNTDLSRAEHLLDRMRAAHPTSWTVGLSTAGADGTLSDLLQRADDELRANKRFAEPDFPA